MLRPYQETGKRQIYQGWRDGCRNMLAVYPTGAGKTVLYSNIAAEYPGASCISAHRNELVQQTSLALAKEGVRHGIIAPKPVVRAIVAQHIDELGRNYHDPNARCRVAGVDTLVGLKGQDAWAQQVGLYVTDEAHHVLKLNKWGRAFGMFPNAYGLGVTATPIRGDGKGLSRGTDGLFDGMVIGPTMRELILGIDGIRYLTPYRIFAPPNDLDLSDVKVTDSGDYSPIPLAAAVHRSKRLIGDVVESYLKFARGKLGCTFAVDIDSAKKIAEAYRKAGIPAEVITGHTPTELRISILKRFRRREILQLVNVDIFGEGFDLPSLEVVSFARPTMSYGLFAQQFGRVLRLLDGKEFGIVIDHVGNVAEHGLPDAPRAWSMNRRERRSRDTAMDALPVTTCLNPTGGPGGSACNRVYERIYPACPFCGFKPLPGGRTLPQQVDGDLIELSPEVLARMRGEIDESDAMPIISPYLPIGAQKKQQADYHARMAEQYALRDVMMRWGGGAAGAHIGHEQMRQREFFLRFGVDVWTALMLRRADAEELRHRIERTMQ